MGHLLSTKVRIHPLHTNSMHRDYVLDIERNPSLLIYSQFRETFVEIRKRVLTPIKIQSLVRDENSMIEGFRGPFLEQICSYFSRTATTRCYASLTEDIEEYGYHWTRLNLFRMNLLDSVKKSILYVMPEFFLDTTTIELTNGSNERCSDLDISVSGPSAAEVALAIVYMLGITSKALLRGKLLYGGMDTVSASLGGIQQIFDIEVYSSSGVIRARSDHTPSGLHQIARGLYQRRRVPLYREDLGLSCICTSRTAYLSQRR